MTVTFSFTVTAPPATIPTTSTASQVAGAEAIRDLKLDAVTNDIVLDSTGDLTFISGVEAIASDLKSRWLAFKGEWFLDLDLGIDYWGVVFVKAPDLGAIEAEYRREALATPGVAAVALTLTRATGRALNIRAQVTTNTGQIFGVVFGVNTGS